MLTEEETVELGERPLNIIESLSVSHEKLEELVEFLGEFKHPIINVHVKRWVTRVNRHVFVHIKFNCKRKDATFLYCHRDVVFMALKQRFNISRTYAVPENLCDV